ncbi:TIGR02679 family protein [Glycomyces arizonensis]|uniref:TIGR02679 family protein n=1 Tax=Glycomyces arizonensis TaxID=256035 RepID=UPI0004103CDE|nr:TIGR02679 family protein [Glycomyces arizonensis]
MTEFGPEWTRLLQAAKRGVEQHQQRISLRRPDDDERKLIIAVTGAYRRSTTGLTVLELDDLAEYLEFAYGLALNDAIAQVTGSPPRDRHAERAARERRRRIVLEQARACRHRGERWFERWVDQLVRFGSIARIAIDGSDFIAVRAALDALPARGEPLPAFAERVLADAKALNTERHRTLLLAALAAWAGTEEPATAEAERKLLEWAGLTPDDLDSQVLVLNVPAAGGPVGSWMTEAAAHGIPLRLTLHQLRLAEMSVKAARIFVCENPAVLRAAADGLGASGAPLVCAEGTASAAAHRLLSSASDAEILWRNDFDWAGVRHTAAALGRYANARPWRMSTADYRGAQAGITLDGPPAETPWDPALADAMAGRGRSVVEESLLTDLLSDLDTR